MAMKYVLWAAFFTAPREVPVVSSAFDVTPHGSSLQRLSQEKGTLFTGITKRHRGNAGIIMAYLLKDILYLPMTGRREFHHGSIRIEGRQLLLWRY